MSILRFVSDSDFGGMVRNAREALDLSPNRVAELVGRSPSTIRAWEKGRLTPSEPSVVSSLAAVLGLDERALFESVGLEPPGPRRTRTLEQTLSEIAPGADHEALEMPSDSEPVLPAVSVRDVRVTIEPGVRAGDSGGDRSEGDRSAEPSMTGEVGPRRRDRRQQSAWQERLRGVGSNLAGTWIGIRARLRTSRAPRPQRSAQSAAPPSLSSAGVGVVAPPRPQSYVEDPEQRLIYRFRSILLAIGVFLLFVVFVWSAQEFLEALGDSLDALFGD